MDRDREREERLVAELELLGVRYLSRQSTYQANSVRPPAALLADLVRQPSPRVRAATIAVLLARPEYAEAVPAALDRLKPEEAFPLRAYYAAAMLLQQQNANRLRSLMGSRWRPLPELSEVTEGLNLPSQATPLERLAALGRENRQRSEKTVNWVGSYEKVARRLIRSWELESQWER
jgi:hypothetical protein